jgi:hypothetical protein
MSGRTMGAVIAVRPSRIRRNVGIAFALEAVYGVIATAVYVQEVLQAAGCIDPPACAFRTVLDLGDMIQTLFFATLWVATTVVATTALLDDGGTPSGPIRGSARRWMSGAILLNVVLGLFGLEELVWGQLVYRGEVAFDAVLACVGLTVAWSAYRIAMVPGRSADK